MKKFMNEPTAFVDEMLDGILAAHPAQLKSVDGESRCLVRASTAPDGKVGIVTGGGSGHLPLFLGYVGEGMLDGCSVGGVFQSPSSDQILKVTRAVDSGKGVLYIYGNYTGDIMNFDMAAELAEMEGRNVATYVAADDVASAPQGEEHKRRGVAGIYFVYKCAGAIAETGADLDEVKRVAAKAGSSVRSMGVALSPVTVPEVGMPSFTIPDGEMEIGMGIHGEPGIRRGELLTADKIVQEMMEQILPDLPIASGDEVSVLMNGLGSTPKEELYIAYRKVADVLRHHGVSVFHVLIGEFATSLEMTGFSISMMRLDEELKELVRAPARTPFFEQAGF